MSTSHPGQPKISPSASEDARSAKPHEGHVRRIDGSGTRVLLRQHGHSISVPTAFSTIARCLEHFRQVKRRSLTASAPCLPNEKGVSHNEPTPRLGTAKRPEQT
jgi:hypothetical protein